MKRYIGFLLLLSTLSLSAQNYTKQFISNSSSELTLNCSSANAFEILLGSNVTISLSNITGAKGIRLWLVQDGTGNRLVHYSSQFTFSPLFKDTTLLTTNSTTVVEFTINDGKIYCTYNSNVIGGSSSGGGGISTIDTTKTPVAGHYFTQYDGSLKVDKVTGKGLSTNDLTSARTAELDSVRVKLNKSDSTTLYQSKYQATLKQNKFNITLSDATSGNQTITLPTAVGISGNIYFVKKIDSSANTVTINTTSSQTIDGATSRVIYDRYSSYMVVSDGSNWYIISTF
jgi:hypothetical protein